MPSPHPCPEPSMAEHHYQLIWNGKESKWVWHMLSTTDLFHQWLHCMCSHNVVYGSRLWHLLLHALDGFEPLIRVWASSVLEHSFNILAHWFKISHSPALKSWVFCLIYPHSFRLSNSSMQHSMHCSKPTLNYFLSVNMHVIRCILIINIHKLEVIHSKIGLFKSHWLTFFLLQTNDMLKYLTFGGL